MSTRAAPTSRAMIAPPSITSHGCSAIERASEVRWGSHSAPFTIKVSTPRASASLRQVGNAAPPSPTIPASRTRAQRLVARACAPRRILGKLERHEIVLARDHDRRVLHERRMRMALDRLDLPRDRRVERHAGLAAVGDLLPRRTTSPFFTIGVAGSPACWRSGSRTSRGGGLKSSIGRAAVCCLCGPGWIPPRPNVCRSDSGEGLMTTTYRLRR